MKQSTFPDFRGKVVSIVFKGDFGRSLQDPRFEVQAGRLFLVGTTPRSGSSKDWVAGLKAAVAWDSVQDYVVFDSPEDWQKRVSDFYRRKRSRA